MNASLSDSAFDVSMPGAQVQAKDIRKLKGLSWINDEIITFYAIMINLRSNAEEARIAALPDPKPKPKEGDLLKVWSFNSFFYAKFTSSQFAGVKRWTKKVCRSSASVCVELQLMMCHRSMFSQRMS